MSIAAACSIVFRDDRRQTSGAARTTCDGNDLIWCCCYLPPGTDGSTLFISRSALVRNVPIVALARSHEEDLVFAHFGKVRTILSSDLLILLLRVIRYALEAHRLC